VGCDAPDRQEDDDRVSSVRQGNGRVVVCTGDGATVSDFGEECCLGVEF
jgi:hypothetical protein